MPKTVWEGGVDPEELAKNLLGISEDNEEEEGALVEEVEMVEPIEFNTSWNVNASQRPAKVVPTRGGVHFFEETLDPRAATKGMRLRGNKRPRTDITITEGLSRSKSSQTDPSNHLDKRLFGSTVERRLRACKNAGLPRRLSQDPHYILVRTIGGREILVHREELEQPVIDYGLED